MCNIGNITILIQITENILNKTTLSDGRIVLNGIEGAFLQVLLDILRLKPTYLYLDDYEDLESPLIIIDNGTADMAFGEFVLNYDRFTNGGMSTPYKIAYFTFAMKKLVPLSTRFAFLYPFTINTWLGFLAVFVFLPFIGLIFLDKKLSYLDISFQMFSCVLKQYLFFPMKTTKSRLFMLFFLIFTMVVSSSYSGIFFSFMVNPLMNPPVRNFMELSKAVVSKIHKCYVVDSQIVIDLLKESSFEHVRLIGQQLTDQYIFDEVEFDYEKVLDEGDAILNGDYFLDLKFGADQDVFVSYDRIFPMMFAAYFRKNFCLKDKINTFISRAWGSGIDQKIFDDVLIEKFITSKENFGSIGPTPLQLHDISGVIILLVAGLGLSLVVLLIEFCVNKSGSHNRTSNAKRERNNRRKSKFSKNRIFKL